MKRNRPRMATLLVLAVSATLNQANGATLKVGDPAPALQVSKWVQGEPVKEFERDKVYIVEFWATWCGPCRVSIPHLNELHTKFKSKGLIVIGQDVLEEDQSRVTPFVKGMGDRMSYRVALDTVAEGQKGKMAETWMDAAGQDGIPTAFVVDQRAQIAWIGHPMELKEGLVEEVLTGNFNVKKAAAEYKERQKKDEQMSALWVGFQKHRQKEEWSQAEVVLAEMEKLSPEDQRDMMRLRRFELLLDRKDCKAAYKLAEQLSDKNPDNVLMQNSMAWDMATRPDIEERDLKLAEKIARRANDAAQGKDAEIVDTLARVLFLKGQQQGAIELQQKAVELADGGRKDQFQKILASYQEGKLPIQQQLRELWHKFNQHRKKGEWEQAETTLGQIEKLQPEGERADLGARRLEVLLDRKDYSNANKLAAQLSVTHKNEPMRLNQIAWEIAIRDKLEEGDLNLAETIARQANQTTKNGNAEILDTLARVMFRKGQKETAVELQEKAVEFAKGRRKAQFQQTLESYKAGKLPEPY